MRYPLEQSLSGGWLSLPSSEPWRQKDRKLLWEAWPWPSWDSYALTPEICVGWAGGMQRVHGPRVDLSPPQSSEQVISHMMERSPCQGQSNLGLYVGLLCALSWSVLSYGRCCFLQPGRVSFIYTHIIRSVPRDRPLPLQGNERLAECSAGEWLSSQWFPQWPSILHPTPTWESRGRGALQP